MDNSVNIGFKLSSSSGQENSTFQQKMLLICFRVPYSGPFKDKSPLPKLDVVFDGVDYHLFDVDKKRKKLPPIAQVIDTVQDGVYSRDLFIATKDYEELPPLHVPSPIEDRSIYTEKLEVPSYLYFHEIHCQRGPHAYFSELTEYAVVYKPSTEELFFIGGYRCSLLFKKEVWVCNMAKRTWYRCASMKRCRSAPIAFHFNGDIYVFGSCDNSEMVTTTFNFAEFYDSVDEAWHYLPPAPTEVLNSKILSHALDDKNGIVYFWFSDVGPAYYYHIHNKEWCSFHPVDILDGEVCDSTFHPRFGVQWNVGTVFLDSFVVWFHRETIYGYDVTKQLFLSLCTLPSQYKSHVDTIYDSKSKSYLFKVGDDKLCLVYECEVAEEYNTLWCHTFSVQYIPLPHIEHQGCHTFNFEGFEVESMHAINPCKEQIKRKIFQISREQDNEVPDDGRVSFLTMLVKGPYPEEE